MTTKDESLKQVLTIAMVTLGFILEEEFGRDKKNEIFRRLNLNMAVALKDLFEENNHETKA